MLVDAVAVGTEMGMGSSGIERDIPAIESTDDRMLATAVSISKLRIPMLVGMVVAALVLLLVVWLSTLVMTLGLVVGISVVTDALDGTATSMDKSPRENMVAAEVAFEEVLATADAGIGLTVMVMIPSTLDPADADGVLSPTDELPRSSDTVLVSEPATSEMAVLEEPVPVPNTEDGSKIPLAMLLTVVASVNNSVPEPSSCEVAFTAVGVVEFKAVVMVLVPLTTTVLVRYAVLVLVDGALRNISLL